MSGGGFRFRSSLPVRIVLPFALALIVVFGVIAVHLGSRVRTEAERELRDRGDLLVQTLAHNAELPLLARDRNALAALLEGAARDPDLLRAEIFDDGGQRLALLAAPQLDADPSGPDRPAALTLESPVLTLGAGGSEQESSAFALDGSPSGSKRRIGAVRLLVSTERTATRTRRLQIDIVIAGVVLLVLCTGIGLGLVKVIGRRLNALVEATRRVAAGDLSVRVDPSSNDEIGELSEAFNRMAADLDVARSEVLAERADLERRVALRSAELERAQETLVQNEKLSAVGQLVAGVAHELNNPLTVVLGYAGLLLESAAEPDVRRKLELLAGEADRSRKIVQNLLTFARKQKPERSAVDTNEVITRTVGLRSYQLRSEKIQIACDLDPSLPRVWADFNQLQQVVLNLVVNAEQAIQDAGKGSRIRIETRRRGERVEIVIEDDGPGIAPAARAKIFEPFFTTKPMGRGTGLGLSICYGIVHENDGTIEVESEPGAFARFIIGLPLAAGEGSTSAQDAAPPPAAATAEIVTRVLVIDDDPGVLRFVTDAFRRRPVTIDAALGGKEGIARLGSGVSYDLVLTDMRMPDVDGRGVYRHIQEHHPEIEEKVVFTSGDVANPEVVAFLHRSGRPILEKPFSVGALRETVSRLAEGRAIEDEPIAAGPAGVRTG